MSTINKVLIGLIILVVVIGAYLYMTSHKAQAPTNEQTQTQNQDQSSSNQNQQQASPTPAPTPSTDNTTPVPDKVVATIDTSLGSIQVTLDSKAAPKTVANFVKLANQGFYNNLTFHRIVKQTGFHLIQGGDPKGDGSGGPGYTVPAEIGLKHTKGAIAMARLGDQVNPNKDSSGSQFYIVEEDIPFLDGNYTVFGYVTSGMDNVLKIGQVQTDANDKPVTPVIIKKITIK